jgi:hypothetical protein
MTTNKCFAVRGALKTAEMCAQAPGHRAVSGHCVQGVPAHRCLCYRHPHTWPVTTVCLRTTCSASSAACCSEISLFLPTTADYSFLGCFLFGPLLFPLHFQLLFSEVKILGSGAVFLSVFA